MIDTIDKEELFKPTLKMETEHFIINYSEMDKPCIDKVSDVLEANYNKVTNNLNEQLHEKLIVEIQVDLNELHIALGFPGAPDWIRGGLGVGKIVIASPLNPPPGSKFDNVVNTAVHEFVHVVIKKINTNIPRWLDEGIASYEAKDNNENWIKNTVRAGLENNTLPSFDDLDTKEDFQAFFKKDGYQYSYTIVESIVNMFGYDKLYRLIKSPNSFVEIFGMTENELQNKWIEYIKKNYMIAYKTGLKNMDWNALFNLYEKAGLLGRFVKNKEFDKIQSAFENSYKIVTAWDGSVLVGAGRMLSDGICYGAIFDVGVLPEYQRKGIGKGIMNELLSGEEHMPIHLTSTFGNECFYKTLGFKKHKTAYSKYPFKTDYVEE